MSAEEVHKFLQTVVQQANKKDDAVKVMEEWVGAYFGKVLQVETDEKFYYVVITKKGARVEEGKYPSPDIIFKAPSDLLMKIFTGRADPIEAIKKWEMIVEGSGHEMVPMNKMIMAVMMGL